MIFIATVYEGEDPRKGITDEIHADTLEEARVMAVTDLVLAYKEAGKTETKQVRLILASRDYDLPCQGWVVTLPGGDFGVFNVPCPICAGKGGVDSGGITPQGTGINIPCPSCCVPEKKSARNILKGLIERYKEFGPKSFVLTAMEETLAILEDEAHKRHEHANFSQTVCAVCSESHPLEVLIGTCPSCRANAAEHVTRPVTSSGTN